MSTPELLLSNQICFLFHRIDLALTQRYKPLLEELDLTYAQYLAMMVMWELEETRVSTVCERLGLDTGTVSPLLKRLEGRGYISRKRDPLDERSVIVSITEAGRILEEKARSIPAAVAGCFVGGAEEYFALKGRLEGLLSNLETRCAD